MHIISNQGKELLLPSCLLVSLLLFAREESIVIDFGNSLGVFIVQVSWEWTTGMALRAAQANWTMTKCEVCMVWD